MKGLSIVLLVVMIAAAGILAVNLYRVIAADTGSGDTMNTDSSGKEYTNDYYTIGNNPTKINKTYFKELNDAIDSGDKQAVSECVVKCFVSEYYTWTNKDGTYDIGGMQYIYTGRQSDFEKYTRDEVYADMDAYITQYGQDNLMEITEVTIDSSGDAGTFAVLDESGNQVEYNAYEVQASWTWEPGEMDLSQADTSSTFLVIDHDGRMEIAAIGNTEQAEATATPTGEEYE